MELNTRRSTRRGNLTRGLKGISDPGWHPILMIQIYLMGNALLLRGAVETLGTSATNRALSKQRAVRSKRKMRSDQIRSDMWPNNKSTATEEQLMIELKMKTWYTIIGYHYGRSGLRMLVLIFILLLILIICIVSSTSSTMCVCVCVFSSHSFWTSSSLDVPAGVTQEEGPQDFSSTSFLRCVP